MNIRVRYTLKSETFILFQLKYVELSLHSSKLFNFPVRVVHAKGTTNFDKLHTYLNVPSELSSK